ncbi:MAG: hypothetical protein IKZ25_04640 [Clostridia bacterium]|nr:hypothetical protein [Clostridia bacterium]
MSDTFYEKVTELLNQYNAMFIEHGIEITIHRRSFTEDVEKFNHYSQHSLLNLLEYVFINRKIEKKKYHHTPNRYKLLVLQVNPIKKPAKKKGYKKYAFLVYQLSRAHQGDKPIEWKYNEQSVLGRVEKRLKKLLERAEKTTSHDWCSDTLWDALRYSFARKYRYIENYCGKSRFFWEMLWGFVFALPVLLFVIGGLICSII